MAKYNIGTDLYDLPEEKIESFLSTYPDAIEVTDEIQEPSNEGKTNGAAAKGATATPVTGPAPESMESDLENGSLELPEIKLNEVVVTTEVKDKTPLTPKQINALPFAIKERLFKKDALTVEDYNKLLYEGLHPDKKYNKAGSQLLNDITSSNANITESQIDAQAFELYYPVDQINKPIQEAAMNKAGFSYRQPTESEKEKRVYDFALASGASEKGAQDYLDTYLNYNKSKELKSKDEAQDSTIAEYKSQALSKIQQRNKELIAGEYPEYIRDYVEKILNPTEEEVKERADERGDIEKTKQILEDSYLTYEVETQQNNTAIVNLEKQINDYDDKIQDLTNRLTINNQANIFQMPGEQDSNIATLNSLIVDRNNLVTGEYALGLQKKASQLGNQYSQILELNNSLNSKRANFIKKYQEGDQALAALAKDYSFSKRATLQLEKSIGGSLAIGGAYVARGVDYLVRNVAPYTTSATTADKNYQKSIDSNMSKSAATIFKSAVDYNQGIQELIAELPEAVKIDEIGEGGASISSFLRDSIANSTPSLLTIAAPTFGVNILRKGFTAGMSLAAKAQAANLNTNLARGASNLSAYMFGIQTGGDTLSSVAIGQKLNPEKIKALKKQVEAEQDPIRKKQLQDEIAALQNIVDKSAFATGVGGLTTGLITGYTERLITLALFKDLNTVAQGVGKNKFMQYLGAVKAFGAAQIKEEGQEISEQVLNNGIVKNVILGENVSIFENVDKDLLANTAVATTLMLGPGTINNVNNIIKENVTTKEELAKYNNLTRELILAQKLPNAQRLSKTKELLLDLGLADIVNISKLNKMSPDDITLVGEITAQMRKISRDAVTLGQSIKGLPTKDNIATLEKLQTQYQSLAENKNKILDGAVNQVNKGLLEASDMVNNPQALFHLNLFDASAIMASGLAGKGNEVIFVEADEQGNRDLSSVEKFKGQEVTYKDNQGNDVTADLFDVISEGRRNAYQTGNTIIIDTVTSKNSIITTPIDSDGKFAAVSPLHEVSHLRNRGKKINFKDKSNQAAITEALTMLDDKFAQGAISEENYNTIKKRLSVYENTGEYEEFMQVLSDAMNLGMIEKSDFQNEDTFISFKSLFQNIANKTFGNNSETFVQFNTGNDVYNYIDSFRKQIIAGAAVKQVDEEEEAVSFSSKAVNDLAVQYKNNKEAMSEQDVANLQDQYQRLGIDALQRWAKQRGVPLQVDENVISDINNQFESVMKNYTPTNRVTGKPMQLSTYVGNILGRRVGPKIVEEYTKRTGQAAITQAVEQTQFADETAEQAFEIEERARAEESGRSKLIDVRQSPRVKRVLPALEKEIKLTEGDSSVEILNNNRSKFASEIYNIPEGKIEKVDNLTYSKNKPETSELGRIQQDFSNAQETERSIKTMPEFNVTTMESTITEQGERVPVSPEVRGRSMKIGQTVLDFFYEPYTDPASESTDKNVRAMAITNKSGRSKGKTTQTKVYRLKPEFRPNAQGKISPQAVSKAREWAGIDVDLNELSKNERRNYATKLAAWARMRGGQVALSVADKSLPESAPKQQRADTRAGRSRLMFSEQGLLDVTQARDINAVLKIVGMDSASVPDSKRAEIQTSFLDSIKKYGLTPNDILAGAFTSSGATRVQVGKSKNGKLVPSAKKLDEYLKSQNIKGKKGDYWYALTDGTWVKSKRVVLKSGKLGNKFVPPANVENLLPQRGRLYYGVNDPAYVTALEAAEKNLKGNKQPQAKRVNVKDIGTEKGKAQAEINMQVLENVINRLDKAVKDGMPKELAAMIIAQGYQATGGLIKIAAPFKYFSKNPQYGTSPKQRTGVKYREEHNPPASVVGASIIYGFATDNTSQIMADIKNNYYQTKLSKADDQKIDDAKLDATLPIGTTISDNPAIRLIEAGIDLNSIFNYETGQTMAEELGVALEPSDVNVQTVFEQNKILKQVLSGDITAETGQNRLDKISKLKSVPKASMKNNNKNEAVRFSEQTPNEKVLNNLGNVDKALEIARDPKAPVKKIRVFDFDDTLAKSNSQVLYEMPDGTTGKLNATQFAEMSGELQEQGAEFDFSEFSKVVDGKKGPVFKAIENIVAKRGAEDVFILTARPANAAGPIKEFMDALGINLPIKNIVGLGDGTAQAKARWITGKAAEGYNDFFFVDDAYKNVKAVQDALNVLDVKSKTQQAKVRFSDQSALDKDFNDIIAAKTGIASEKQYSRAKAEVVGASKGGIIKGIPYSAQDLVGLLYSTLSKGKLGDQQMAWYQEHVIRPYARAINDLDTDRVTLFNDYKELKKQLGVVPKNLRKKIPGEPFTREQAVRVYIWDKQGMTIPGISKTDLKELTDYVDGNAELQVFADQLISLMKGDDYAAPKQGWLVGGITTDLIESLNTNKRSKYLKQWNENVDIIFSEKNLNKLEAAYGKKYRVAMENMLQRMRTGRNRNFSDDTLTAKVGDWVNGSIGVTMFFNTRSALLQTISAINFINFTDNNPLAASKAFANQKQYWSDFISLMNSDFLKARRGGLRMNVNEADIADMAKKGGAKAVINKILELGFTPTQIMDSFAIASGGATFYRNRIKTYTKQGLSQAEAEAKAFEDFRETAEESQQSARPDKISMQQAGPLGRFILAFGNTPAQYLRLTDKAVKDLIAGRGDAKTNISKIVYYTTVQNILFNALQQAVFALGAGEGDEEDQKKQEKYFNVANGMADSLLRGAGIGGNVLSVVKNTIITLNKELEKPEYKQNLEKLPFQLLKVVPPVASKYSRISQAARSYKWDKEEMKEKGWSLDNPAYLAGANVISAATNIPLDRAIRKANNIAKATDSNLETWERLALLGGWQDWELNIEDENKTNKPQPRKSGFKNYGFKKSGFKK